ncbi:hypothetical protein Csa_007971 [Cucumis sativus]|uniref:Uncharacterized protein n=1 Tax=Cucumis sativus TaxID=3659 RepID=A0A0A0KUA3_CUCSA|nr:hypothetical protein Csa_007971 [Cucumis sativus]
MYCSINCQSSNPYLHAAEQSYGLFIPMPKLIMWVLLFSLIDSTHFLLCFHSFPSSLLYPPTIPKTQLLDFFLHFEQTHLHKLTHHENLSPFLPQIEHPRSFSAHHFDKVKR